MKCPTNWKHFGRRCFGFVLLSHDSTYDDAQKSCLHENASVPIIPDNNTFLFITNFTRNHNVHLIWVTLFKDKYALFRQRKINIYII